MTDDLAMCRECEWMQTDNQMRRRCYSPQLRRLRLGGILINFERDDTTEEGRIDEDGTGKCGPQKLNFKRRIGV